jgi:two-component system, NtrC family, sensor histidine kinase PilS
LAAKTPRSARIVGNVAAQADAVKPAPTTWRAALSPIATSSAAGESAAWRSLQSFAVYRLLIAVLLSVAYWGFHSMQVVGAFAPLVASTTLIAYLALGVLLYATAVTRFPSKGTHLSTQVLVDVVGITLLMYASGGTRSGIGLLLLVTLAAAGLVSRGRMIFFHAALAALAVLLAQSWQYLEDVAQAGDFVQAGLLAGTFFVLGGVGHTLGRSARGAEQIAEARGVDLANLGQINELVIRDMADGFVVVDERGVIRQHNAQSAEIVAGLRDAGGRPLREVAPQLALLLEQWRRNSERIFPITRDAATQTDYQVRFIAVGSDALSPTVIYLEDVGRIRSQAQQMKLVALGRLTASIAHEIRNPLSSINHAAELLQEDEGRTPADQRLLSIIRDNSQRLDRMVQEVLYLNRRDRANPEPIDAAAYLNQFARDVCANEKVDASLLSVVCESQRKVIFDRGHLDQILWNLTRNALRHCRGQAGSVSIMLAESKAPNVAELTVADDGPGVPIQALPHLFEPFFTTENEGTGLGLYIARELAEVNGARLDYQSPDDGMAHQGARFSITMKSQ